jgi:kynurenine 3-monooxygenase
LSIRAGPINIIGGGLAGSLLALLLARRGFVVTVFERRADPRLAAQDGGRSINLALASRGIAALTRAGIERQVDPLLIAMRGRMIHEHAGDCALQLYGQTPREVIYSVSRSALNRVLLAAADAHPNVTLRFGHSCLGAHPGYRSMHMRDEAAEHAYELPLGPTFATDGAGSAVRASLIAAGATDGREQLLEHDYKELTIPAPAANSTLARDALHIWPRGDFMLIALPNTDGSFTATLFLPRSGPNSFATLPTHAAVQSFFAREFPATVGLIPDLAQQFFAHPQGIMGTVYCDRWHAGGDLLMLGDAAHAIVPFHGQGMNCAFEDCGELTRQLGDAVCRFSAPAQAQYRCHRRDGPRKLSRDARGSARPRLLAAQGSCHDTGKKLPNALHTALFDGHVPSRNRLCASAPPWTNSAAVTD